ncbi:MAG: family 78 glycoside hydrolase catalytic domain, partial [Tepidisphaeraceae bacterium]
MAVLIGASIGFAAESPVRLTELTAEHMEHPVGIGVAQPRLSWKLQSDRPGEIQTAYEVRAASSRDKLDQPDLWSSGKVVSDQSVLVRWGGKPLDSRAIAFWQVRVWHNADEVSDWSEPASFELGLVHPETEWKGQWITANLPRYDIMARALSGAAWIDGGATQQQPTAARITIDLPVDANVKTATIAAAAAGLISLYVNGNATRQGASSHTAPFHASFGQQLQPGRNVIGLFSLAVRVRPDANAKNNIAAHAVIELQNGRRIDVNTNGKWKATAAPGDNWFGPNYDDSGWKAAIVEGPYSELPPIRSADGTIGPGRYLRKSFTVKGPVAKARLYATALGVYEASINGKPVSDDQLAPGWTDYFKRTMVQTYDVTNLLQPGETNVLGALLGDGWFAGRVGWMGLQQYKRVADHPSFNAQLEITYADGTMETIASDGSWKGGPGQIVGSDEQFGEVQDARKAVSWDQTSFDDSRWPNVTTEKHDNIELDPQLGVPVRKLMELSPKKISRMGGVWIVDFGQNMVGHVRLRGVGAAGDQVEIQHGEMLNPDGTLYNENLRQAISLDEFTFAGTGKLETFEPHFTFHGFRYAQITGYPGELTADNIRGIVVGSDMPDTGTIITSNADVNQLVSNIRWGQRGNFLSVPTDCPQRDERMGWMGDAQVFAPTAAYNADVSSFFSKWMVDVNDGQLTVGPRAGAFCVTSPRVDSQAAGYPIWGDAGVVIPWVMYTTYGDRAFLEQNYDHMARWVDFNQRRSDNLLLTGGVGDHLAPLNGGTGRGGAGSGGTNTTTAVLDTAYFAHSARIVSQSAAILGKTADAAKYDRLYHDISDAFVKAYVHEDGNMVAGTQSTYVVALSFGLIPNRLHDAVAKRLVDDVTSRGHLSTGFVGVGFLNPTLSATGRSDLAFQLLLTDTYPSWLFSVKQGATTVWERWDGYTPLRGFQASGMNSFNHYSLGSIGKWLYSGAGGIGIDEGHPGFKHFFLAPQFSTKFTSFKATLNSPYGLISSAWRVENNRVIYDVTVPPNTTATLTLPAKGNDLMFAGAPIVRGENGAWTLAAGAYKFSFPASSIR